MPKFKIKTTDKIIMGWKESTYIVEAESEEIAKQRVLDHDEEGNCIDIDYDIEQSSNRDITIEKL